MKHSSLTDFSRYAAFDAAGDCDWPAEGSAPPAGSEWQRAEVAPQPGQTRWVKIDGAAHQGELRWLLFVPALGALNGWDDHPETIARSAFVSCRLEVPGPQHWWQTQVAEIVPFEALEERVVPQRPEGLRTSAHGRETAVRFADWELLWAPYDDAGYWLLARVRGDVAHVVAAGEWLPGSDGETAWGGHAVIPLPVWRDLLPQ